MYNIIVNKCSGFDKGEKVLNITEQYLKERNIPYALHATEKIGHAEDMTRSITKEEGEHKLLVIGGDGTFHEVLNGIEDFNRTVVGFVPGGRGNDFARAAGISRKTVKALDNIMKNEEQRIDILNVGDRRCLNIAGTGLDIAVLEHVTAKGSRGKLGYVFGLMHCLRDFEPYKIKVHKGSEVLEREVILVTTCNGSYFGGGIKISPFSKPNDGVMDIVIINMVKRFTIPFIFMQFIKGRHLVPKQAKYAEHFSCDYVEVENASSTKIQLDGEVYNGLPYKASISPATLRTVGFSRVETS